METLVFKPQGVCSRTMTIQHENGVVVHASVEGGCNGNLQGICSLIEGMPIDKVVEKLSGIRCGFKQTSCPDQLAKGLSSLLQ